jgi:hypothetical protein
MSASSQKTGLAVTSLVLGILSLVCLGIFLGIPAVILGHIAYSRSRKQPDEYGGGGVAIAGLVTGYLSIVTTLVLAAMLLPALAHAKNRAQLISCQSQMMQIGMAMRVWEGDNGDRFPFNVSTNQGGTMELCLRGDGGFDRNAVNHFQVMSNELGTPRILVCPADSSKQPADNFRDLESKNISYLLRSGTNVTSDYPKDVLLRCPIHGTILRCDGSIERGELQRR